MKKFYLYKLLPILLLLLVISTSVYAEKNKKSILGAGFVKGIVKDNLASLGIVSQTIITEDVNLESIGDKKGVQAAQLVTIEGEPPLLVVQFMTGDLVSLSMKNGNNQLQVAQGILSLNGEAVNALQILEGNTIRMKSQSNIASIQALQYVKIGSK